MTDAINFFQSMFVFKSHAPSGASKQEVRLAVWLKREAKNLAATAELEIRNAEIAQNLAMTATETEKIRDFTEIAIWHYNRAAEKYRKSAERFSEAGAIRTGKSREFINAAGKMSRYAVNAESALNFLNSFLKN